MRRLALIAIVVCSSGCGMSPENYQELVDEARACGPGDQCVLAGGGQCTCPTPVNQRDADRIDQAAGDVACGGARVECAAHLNVRCEAGRCRSG